MYKKFLSTTIFTLSTAAILIIAWLERNEYWYDAESGLGYSFGIIGSSMMLLLLLYPLRKHWKPMARLFKVHHWFRFHMIFGVWGPCFILLHSNYRLGSLNSQIALYSMLLVAGSGLIGRYVYQRLHRGLYGEQIEFSELNEDYQQSKSHFNETSLFTPELQQQLIQLENQLNQRKVSFITAYFAGKKISKIQRKTKKQAKKLLLGKQEDVNAITSLIANITHWNTGLVKLQKMANFALYLRLFSMWHVFHLPIFIMMIITAIVHIFVVHMY